MPIGFVISVHPIFVGCSGFGVFFSVNSRFRGKKVGVEGNLSRLASKIIILTIVAQPLADRGGT